MKSPGAKPKAVKKHQRKKRGMFVHNPGSRSRGRCQEAPRGEPRGRCAAPRSREKKKVNTPVPTPPHPRTPRAKQTRNQEGLRDRKVRLWGLEPHLALRREGGAAIFGQRGERAGGFASLPACASRRETAGQTHHHQAPIFNGKMPPKVRTEPGRALLGSLGATPGSERPRRAGPVFLGSGALISAAAGASPGPAPAHEERVTDPGAAAVRGGVGSG